MKCKRVRFMQVSVLFLLLLLSVAALAHAQTGGGYDLTWSSVDGGGWMFSASGGYSLGGTAGQPDAGVMNNGGYSLVGGFWSGAIAQYKIYLPVTLKN